MKTVRVTHEIVVRNEDALRAFVKERMPHFDYRSEEHPDWTPGIDDWSLEQLAAAATSLTLVPPVTQMPGARHDPALRGIGIIWPWEG